MLYKFYLQTSEFGDNKPDENIKISKIHRATTKITKVPSFINFKNTKHIFKVRQSQIICKQNSEAFQIPLSYGLTVFATFCNSL